MTTIEEVWGDRQEEPWEVAEREHYARVAALAEDWRKRWPDHCPKCKGWGGFEFVERHGFKHGPGESIFDPCEGALPNIHQCHRCGKLGLDGDGLGPCRLCGWDFDDGEPMP